MSITEQISPTTAAVRGDGLRTSLLRRRVLESLERVEQGRITIRDGAFTRTVGGSTEDDAFHSDLTVHDPRFYAAVAFGGSLGAGEAYIKGYWSSDDLPTLMRILARNGTRIESIDRGLARLLNPLRRVAHWLNRNTRAGSLRNIAAHYDLGNDFYALFLDETLTYSAAYFESEDSTLAEASEAKLDRLCRKLNLGANDRVLEIGSGWGSFALHAARRYGCRVTTTTISAAQAELARRRVAQAGLSARVEVLQRDYRDLHGQFDKVVSIEMIEAVGHSFLPTYFGVISKCLKPDGMAALQAITLRDQEYDRFRRSTDFIQRYVFPGSCITAASAMLSAMKRGSDLSLAQFEDTTPHYARTLLTWRENFHDRLAEIRALGFDAEFLRLWDYYLCYCAGGFAERWIGVGQWILTKPACGELPALPAAAAAPAFAPAGSIAGELGSDRLFA